ncbi:MAG: TonB-dependent receptor plug domain-containing protein [Bacteroidota bacterium]
MRLRNILAIFAITLFTLSANAQFSIDTIEVDAVRIPLKINETGRNISVLDAKQIEALPASSIDELLKTIPGIEVQARGGFGVQGDITMRGSTFTQVLVLIDGIKLNDPLTGHFNNYLPVTPAEIERIEVLRGAAAAMYGADAVGGVINIVTKAFSNTKEGINLSGALNYGEHKLVTGYQGFSVKKGNATFGGGFSMNQSEGEFFPETVIDSNTTLSAYNNFFDIKTVGASFGYQFNNSVSLKMRTSYDYRDFGARYFYTTSTFDKSEETVANWWNHLSIGVTGQNSSTDFNLAYKFNTDEFVFSPDFPSTNNHKTQLLNATINRLQVINDQFTLKAGLQADHRRIESNDRGDHDDIHMGIYTMGVYRNNGLNLSLSLRADYDSNYDFEFSPQLNFSWVFPTVTIRASAGRSIRAADYTERYVSNNLQNLTPGRSLGNPELLAERGWSEEIGLDYTVLPNWQLKTTVFSRQSTNLIDFVSTNQAEIGSVSEIGSLQEGADYFFAKNITRVTTTGFEVESVLSHNWGNRGRIDWHLGYTFLNTTNDEDVISVYISSHAKHLVTNRLVVGWDRFELATTGLFKVRDARVAPGISAELTHSYSVWNISGSADLTENFGLNIQLRNVFNTQYQNILGARMPSRWFMGGITWNL